MGIRSKVSRNTRAHANQVRPWQIYADFAQLLIGQARQLYAEESFATEIDQTMYALDSTIIDVWLSLFTWAKFRKHKGAVKLHTLLDLQSNIPTVVFISDAKVHDVNILDQIAFEPGAFYILDRAYFDFARLYTIHECSAFFVTRPKSDFHFDRLYSQPVDKFTGLQCDQIIMLHSLCPHKGYPEKLRRIRFYDKELNRRLIFLTNNFCLSALTVTKIYKCRWQIELFFKWIKQHLRIKAFYGTSENAVKTQIWIAMSVYVLVALVKKRLNLDQSLYTILQMLSVTLFEKTPILRALSSTGYITYEEQSNNQLKLVI
jgi:transposase